MLLGYAGIDPERWRAIQPDPATTAEAFFELDPTWVARGAWANPTLSPVAVVFRCCSPHLAPADLLVLRDLVRHAPAHPDALAKLDALARQIPDVVGRMRDYVQGYELAAHVRAELENEDQRLDIEALVEDELHIPVREIELGDPDLDGGSICDAQHGPLVFINRSSLKAQSPWGRRMVLAYELCHLLFDRQKAVPLAVMSGPWAPPHIERRANAFAAELLLPLAGIERRLQVSPRNMTDKHLRELMKFYQVGLTTCVWHLRNRAGWGE